MSTVLDSSLCHLPPRSRERLRLYANSIPEHESTCVPLMSRLRLCDCGDGLAFCANYRYFGYVVPKHVGICAAHYTIEVTPRVHDRTGATSDASSQHGYSRVKCVCAYVKSPCYNGRPQDKERVRCLT